MCCCIACSQQFGSRLSIGISLIGNPKIWLLDEPSTGALFFCLCFLCSPVQSRCFAVCRPIAGCSKANLDDCHQAESHWCVFVCECVCVSCGPICVKLLLGRTTVITTHSMEEADTLCTKI